MLSRWMCASLGVAMVCAALGCSKEKDKGGPESGPGTITATVVGIPGQMGKVLAVGVTDYDWYPGAEGDAIGLVMEPILNDDFSSSVVVQGLDASGQPTGQPRTFDPATYSVVFFVASEGAPPEAFVELRVTVNGNMTVQAPPWSQWFHPPARFDDSSYLPGWP